MNHSGNTVDPTWFARDVVDCARALIGAELVWGSCTGMIVETEAYAEHDDPACHTAFRPSARAFMADHEAGTSYVYLNYGIHWLFNILTHGSSGGGFVLIRALKPVRGLALMRKRRGKEEEKLLCSGPGKLTQALGINGTHHGKRFLLNETRALVLSCREVEVEASQRIGISRGQNLPWRFTLAGSSYVSR